MGIFIKNIICELFNEEKIDAKYCAILRLAYRDENLYNGLEDVIAEYYKNLLLWLIFYSLYQMLLNDI